MRRRYHSLVFSVAAVSALLIGNTSIAQGPPDRIVQRVLAAHGGRAAEAAEDSAGEGKLTLFGTDGPKAAFDVRLLRKGTTQVQRVIKQPAAEIRQGSDGTHTWESAGGFFTPAAQGHALHFIESQTVRSVHRLFRHPAEGLTLKDLGTKDKAGVIEAEDRQGRKTSYFIDPDTERIARLEFVTGAGRDPLTGNSLTVTDAYVFSDYRMVQGVLTPFKVERFNGTIKTEEMQFTTFTYGAGLKDQDFKR